LILLPRQRGAQHNAWHLLLSQEQVLPILKKPYGARHADQTIKMLQYVVLVLQQIVGVNEAAIDPNLSNMWPRLLYDNRVAGLEVDGLVNAAAITSVLLPWFAK
jgi:hypothetical protein